MLGSLLTAAQASWEDLMAAVRAVSVRPSSSRTVFSGLVAGASIWIFGRWLTKKRPGLPPGPWSWPLVGHLPWVNSKKEQFYVTLDRWAREEGYGPIMTVYFGRTMCITLNDWASVNEALVQKGSDYAGRPQLYTMEVISEGYNSIIFTDVTETWKHQRTLAVKALRNYTSGRFEKTVHDATSQVLDKMATEPGPFNPHVYNSTLMFQIINGMCFGEMKPFDDPSIHMLIALFDESNEEVGNGMWEDIVPLLRYWPTKRFRRVMSKVFEFYDYIEKNIKEHRGRENRGLDVTDAILFLQSQMGSRASFADVHTRQTVSDLFGAGMDASRLTLDWAMLFLAGHPEIQTRAQEEIDAVSRGSLPSMEHKDKLRYTRAVLQEVQRLGSVAPIAVLHKALNDTSVGGFQVPKGTMVLMNIWAVTHDPRVWEDPDHFRPERFLDSEGKLKPTPKEWIPFSAGRRSCLGEHVARSMLLLVLARCLKRFTFSLPPGVTYDPSCMVGMMAVHAPKPYQIVVTARG